MDQSGMVPVDRRFPLAIHCNWISDALLFLELVNNGDDFSLRTRNTEKSKSDGAGTKHSGGALAVCIDCCQQWYASDISGVVDSAFSIPCSGSSSCYGNVGSCRVCSGILLTGRNSRYRWQT